MIMTTELANGTNIKIPVSELEFNIGGNTIWIHSPLGTTILRIKTLGKITVDKCDTSPTSHADIISISGINFCLAEDAEGALES